MRDNRESIVRLRNCGFLLKDLSRRFVLRFEQRASEIGLTLPQCQTLVRLECNEGVSQVKLAELTDVEPMTMVRILDCMQAGGFLERRPDPADRRASCLYLTAKAEPILDEIWRMVDLTRAEIFAGVSRPDRDAFLGVLEHLHRNICALDGQPVEASPCASLTQPTPAAGDGTNRPAQPKTR